MSDKPNEDDPLNPERYLVHLNHPCYEIDTWYTESDTDIELGRRQGYVSLAELRTMQATITKLCKQLESIEAHSAKLQLASDDLYQGYMDELNRMSGWPELRTEIEWFADNNFYE